VVMPVILFVAYIQASLPTSATAKARQNLLDTISYVVASYGPQFRLALFGSAAIGGDREESDMDLCIVVRLPSDRRNPPC
jgi:DNA polymerase sigma